VFLGGIFCAFWDILQKNRVGSFLYGLCICCVVYMEYMFSLNQEQLLILGWVITIGGSIIVMGMTILLSYCLYCLYKLIKNFSNKN